MLMFIAMTAIVATVSATLSVVTTSVMGKEWSKKREARRKGFRVQPRIDEESK